MATRRTTDAPETTDPLRSSEGDGSRGGGARAPQIPAKRPARRRSAKAEAALRQSGMENVVPSAASVTPARPPARIEVSPQARRTMIAEAAYLRAERRGFTPGYELEDWLAAEREIDTLLAAEHVMSAQ